MKNLKALLKFFALLFILLSFSGCVKDIDLDQAQEIQLKPIAVIELVNLSLEADLSDNDDPGIPVTLEETIPFEVVTDDLKESVIRVDLSFDYFNSLPRTFNGAVYFLNDKKRVKQEIQFVIPPGSKQSPESYQFIHTFSGEDLKSLHQATHVKVELEMQPGPGAVEGLLQLKSTAAYRFQF